MKSAIDKEYQEWIEIVDLVKPRPILGELCQHFARPGIKAFLGLLLCTLPWLQCPGQQVINLKGQWQFCLEADEKLAVFADVVTLPGTTDTNKKGTELSSFAETTRLSRRFSYKGKAWYQREVVIPDAWAGQPVTLLLERTKYTEVFVDNKSVGHCNDISTPQRYDLSTLMTPGKHVLTIMVDNGSGVPEQIYASSHAYTEDTQTNWNGIIGRIELRKEGLASANDGKATTHAPLRIQNGSQLYLNGKRIFLRGKHDACVWPLTGHVAMDLQAWMKYLGTLAQYGINHVRFHSWCPPEAAFLAADSLDIILQPELPFWGDFNAKDSVLMTFLHKEGMNILREYGHHKSFRMFALGNELWGSIEKMAEFVADFRRIAPDKLYTYGSNFYLGYKVPAMDAEGGNPDFFVTCRVGGEGWGNYHTHTRGSFSFADAADGGMINHFRPNASMNFEEGCKLSPVPVISHETAQFQSYPNYGEIGKYTGVLRPCNLEVFRNRLKQAGMGYQTADFHRASGRWAYLLYKQDIEMDLRTPGMAGFQLLDLQDYPGQGSAYVGMLDAFMDSKGFCTVEEWRQFCSPVVPLLVADAYCFTTSEGIRGKIQLANYSGGSLQGQKLFWECGGQKGELTIPEGEGLLDIAPLNISLNHISQATQLKLVLKTDSYSNSYDLWAYPAEPTLDRKKVIVTDIITDEIGKRMEKGASVLLMPRTDTTSTVSGSPSTDSGLWSSANRRNSVGGLFQTDYWNYRMFKTISENNKKDVSPGTLGILCNPKHPLFRDFPTEEHTNWQWFPVIKESRPLILDYLPLLMSDKTAARPLGQSTDSWLRAATQGLIVQVIDNIERNHRLGLVFEFQVGRGRLLVVMSNLEKAAQYPEGRQFYASVLNYMHSSDFAPQTKITLSQLRDLFTRTVSETQLDELNNISPY